MASAAANVDHNGKDPGCHDKEEDEVAQRLANKLSLASSPSSQDQQVQQPSAVNGVHNGGEKAKEDEEKVDGATCLPSSSSSTSLSADRTKSGEVDYVVYESELQMPDIMRLIQKDLSEPYSIYTYRYFIHNWPHLCFMVRKITVMS